MKRLSIISLTLVFLAGCASTNTSEESTSQQTATESEPAETAPSKSDGEESESKAKRDDLFEPIREAYREALYNTKQAKPEAREAIAEMEAELEKIKKSAENWPEPYNRAKEETKQTIAELEAAIDKASEQVEEDVESAHITLEPVREDLAELRSELGIQHPSDAMTRFHETMEETVERAEETPIDWEREREAAKNLEEGLEAIESSFENYGEEADCETTELGNALEDVDAAIDREDGEDYREATKNLRKEFQALFQMCG